MSETDKWMSGDIDSRLENLFDGLDETELGNQTQRAYQDAAAVLASFDPNQLNPVPATSADEPPVEMLGPPELASISTEARWVLAPDLRRESLKRLVGENRIEEALAANPDRRKDLLQVTFERYLRGESKLLNEQTVRELQASLQVCDWLYDIVPVPSIEDLRRRIENETLLRPFHDLVGERFAGRETEMNQLSDYVGVYAASAASETAKRFVESIFSIRRRPPLMIEAPGGMGKSTLIAQFILINSAAQHVQRFPFAYLDFDRPGLIAEEPVTLLLDAVRQFAVQFRDARERAAQLRQEWQNKAREKGAAEQIATGSTKFIRFNDPMWFYDGFARFVSEILPADSPVLLVLDTFEEVQYRSRNFVEGVFDFLDAMQSRIPALRTVLAGRAGVKMDKYSVRVMKLPPFDRDAAQAFLEKQGVASVALGYTLADQVGGSPLTLKLAARLVNMAAEEAGPDGIRNLETGLMARVKGRSIEAQLYDRILDHIHDTEVRKLAHPGLILRKITEDLILEVLAEPCGVDVSKPGRAAELFEKLGEEIALVESGDPGVLMHRPDVRSVTLRMLVDDQKMRSAAAAINEKAIHYYAGRTGSENRAEEIYHLLLFDLDRSRVEPRAGDDAALRLITRSIEDLPDRSQAFLAARVEIERSDRVWKSADLPDWELYAARLARENLLLHKPEAALSCIRQRLGRTPDSALHALEMEALIQTGELGVAVRRVKELLAKPDGISDSVRGELLAYETRLQAMQRASQSQSIPPAAETSSKAPPAALSPLMTAVNQMIECQPPDFPVVYTDGEEHFGEWVETRGAHKVNLPRSFFISPFLVSNELFLEFVRDRGYDRDEFWIASKQTRSGAKTADGKSLGPANWPSASSFPAGKARHPVACLSYIEVCAFIAWVNAAAAQTGWQWSLPPEDCWEFAARGENSMIYPWGNDFDAARCNSTESSIGDTTEVDKYQAGRSPVGCFDMAGNVWEFVEPANTGQECVLRGGSFKNNADVVRSHLRLHGVPKRHRPVDFGFRLCRLKLEVPKPEVSRK